MKALIFAISLSLCLSSLGQSLEAITVTTQSINITGNLAVGTWMNEHPNQPFPNYPKLYYGFAEGDEIIIDLTTENKKGTQIIEVSEFDSKSVVYSNKGFQTLEGIKIKVPKTSVYKFEFATNHVFDRHCKITIKRIPSSEGSKNFNCNVAWRTVNDTTFQVVQEKRQIGSAFEAITLQSPINHFINGGRHATFLGGKSRIAFPITLPENTVEWYYTVAATRNEKAVESTKSSMRLYSDLAKIVTSSTVLGIALNVLSQPPGADYCDVYLLHSSHFQFFLNKDDDKWGYYPEGTRLNIMSGIVKIKNEVTKGTVYIGLKNPDAGVGVNVMIEIVAIVEKASYEIVEVKKPVNIQTKTIPVFGS